MLSGYATWWARRHRHSGHLFQGRFRAQLIEDESYFWTVSRYLHLNLVRAKLVNHPRDWDWSSYRGYDSKRRRLDWVAYDMLTALQAEYGGVDPAGAYRRYVTAGLSEPLVSPFSSVWQGLVIGSEELIAQVKRRLTGSNSATEAISPKRLAGLDRKTIYKAVLSYYERPDEALEKRGDRDWPRAVAAYLARRCTDASLRELAADLGLTRADSVPNLTRRVERDLPASATLRAGLRAIEDLLQAEIKTKNKVDPGTHSRNPLKSGYSINVRASAERCTHRPLHASMLVSNHSRFSRPNGAIGTL